MRLELDLATMLLPPLKDVVFEKPLPDDTSELQQAVLDYLAEHCPVEIDGVPVQPKIHEFSLEKVLGTMHLADFKNLVIAWIVVDYPLVQRPKTIRCLWDVFLEPPPLGWAAVADPDQDPSILDVQMKVYKKYRWFKISPDEPEFIWRAEPEGPDPAQLKLAIVETPPTILPLLSIGTGVLALILVIAFAAKRKVLPALATIGLAGAIAWFGRDALPLALKAAPPQVPAADEAEAVFDTLLANIYRSFEYAEDDAIYQSLAQSVDGPLLAKIFKDVFKSLILEENGGVMCTVDKLDIQTTEFGGPVDLVDTDLQGFQVQSRWEVVGKVSHWGHSHERLNKMMAQFQLEPRGGQWRITEMDVKEQKRINPNEGQETPASHDAGEPGPEGDTKAAPPPAVDPGFVPEKIEL